MNSQIIAQFLLPQALGKTSAPRFSALTLNAGGSGFQLYNTADQTTNYERFEILWSSNAARVQTTSAGSGTLRNLILASGGSGNSITIKSSGSVAGAVVLDIPTTSSAANNRGVQINAASTQTSGGITSLVISPTYNQASGTAANTDLLINRTETAVGSGGQYLLRGRVGSSDYFSVSNLGAVMIAGGAEINYLQTATGTLNYGSIAGGASETLTISVGSAPVGAQVDVDPNQATPPEDGIFLRAWVSATGTVSIRAINWTALPIDPASIDVRVTVIGYS